MVCCVADLRDKEIINLKDGCRLGSVCDVEINTETGQLVCLIIYGRGGFLACRGKTKDIKIRWEQIEVIGDDTILVRFDCPPECRPKKNKGRFEELFRQG